MEALYILSPDEFSIQCLITDYARPKPRYTGAHLLWTSGMRKSYFIMGRETKCVPSRALRLPTKNDSQFAGPLVRAR